MGETPHRAGRRIDRAESFRRQDTPAGGGRVNRWSGSDCCQSAGGGARAGYGLVSFWTAYLKANFDSTKLLLVQPIGGDGKDVGRPLVAVDSVGAGVGETVFFVRGKEASFPFHPTEVPTDAGIVGIVDHFHVPATD